MPEEGVIIMNGPEGSSVVITTEDKVSKLKAEILYQRAILPQMIEMQIIFSQITREKYLSLISVGFSKEDALFLCK